MNVIINEAGDLATGLVAIFIVLVLGTIGAGILQWVWRKYLM